MAFVEKLSVDQQIEAFYIAYYGAAADAEGFAKWEAKYARLLTKESGKDALEQIGDYIGYSKETTALYPFLKDLPYNPHSAVEQADAKALVDTIYQNLLGVAPPAGDPALNKLVHDFLKETTTISEVVLKIANTATGAELTTMQNKLAVATDFTAATTAAGFGFPPSAAYLAEAKLVVADTTSDPTTVTTQEAAINAWIAAGGGATGQTYNLTPGIDNIDITTVGTYDTVKGIIDQKAGATDTTFTVGDTITGNGHTVVDIAVANLSSNDNAQLVTMSGVSTVNILQGQSTYDLIANAGTWGSVNNINVSGFDGSVTVEHLNVTNGGGISLNIATTGAAHLIAETGKVSGLSYYADVRQANGVGSVAKFGTAGIDATLGKGGGLSLELWQSVDHSNSGQGAASVGDINIAHINVNVGQSADADYVELYNYARAYSNNATVGNITVGNVNFTIDQNGYAELSVYNEAYVETGKGNALAGNVTLGNITMHATGKAGSFEGYVYNEAYNYGTGNATVGNLTLGNVSLTGNDYGYVDVYQEAYVEYHTGNATAGNLTVGNVSLVDGTADYHELYLSNEAYVYGKGSAQVGNITVGALNMTAAYDNYVEIDNYAYARYTGSATAGSIALGNVTMSAKSGAYNDLTIYNEAYIDGGKGGAATVGNLTIGALSMAAASGHNYVDIYNTADNYGSKSGNATVGNTSVGNVTMTHNADQIGHNGGYNELSIWQSAYAENVGNAKVGNISIGNVSINPGGVGLTGQTHAENHIDVYNEAYAYGAKGIATVGAITIGNVTAVTGASGYVDVYANNYAFGHSSADAAGLVTIGNVSMKGAGNADMYVTAYDEAPGGNAAGIAIGNVSLVGTKALGTAELYAEVTGATTGKIAVGNVAITDSHVDLYVYNRASTGAAGGITVGSITLKGNGTNNYVEQYASHGSTGAISVGNVSLSVGHGQDLSLSVLNQSPLGKAGDVTLGNVSLGIANTNAGAANYADLYVHTTGTKGGNITAGNITIGSAGDTTHVTAANMAGHVTLDSAEGNVLVGNITVSGGVENAAHTIVADNLSTIGPGSSWLHLTAGAGGTITVGNIDYSGYASAATINVESYLGAASIVGSQGGSTITDNSGTNAINVSHASAADTIYLQGTTATGATTQTGVVDSGTAITATQSAMDSIIGIHSGDSIEFSNGTGGGTAIGNGGASLVQAGAMTFATFLANAETQVDTNHNAVYTGDVSGTTYVAMANAAGHVGEIVGVTGVHTFTLTTGELHYLS